MNTCSPIAYQSIVQFVLNETGIVLGEDKAYLVESRLRPVLRQYEFPSFEALAKALQTPPVDGCLHAAVVSAMSTHETSFFRDGSPFEALASTVVPDIAQAGRQPKIWCAAASTGQEPWSICMALHEAGLSAALPDDSILATDICEKSIDHARSGRYSGWEAGRGLLPGQRDHFFDQDGSHFVLKPALRRLVSFDTLNLMDPYPYTGQFDIIFLRNVLIYFSEDRKADICKRMHACLRPGGWLVLGGSESLAELRELYQRSPFGTTHAWRKI